ncbi:MAG: ribonuclease HI [Flavobacteriaceae bacterium]
MPEIHIYTDGSSLGNPGPGGYGIIIEWVGKGYIKEFSRGFKYTTNNRMELWAVIDALEKLKKKPMDVLIISDSKYVIEAIEKKWVFGWQKKNFKGKKNPDLWKRFLKIYPQHNVQFQWVKGHNNHPQNERCDQLAVTAAKDMAIEQDIYYEQLKQKA